MRLETVQKESPLEMLKHFGVDVQVAVSMSLPEPRRALIDRDSVGSNDHHGINESDMLISFLKEDFGFEITVHEEITIDDKGYIVEKLDKNGAWLDLELLGRGSYA